ncbi:hypothetical protein P8452_60731 [Trifolium repens]|nr:hypothetical protein P8452_60731 [Trifolium repens]
MMMLSLRVRNAQKSTEIVVEACFGDSDDEVMEMTVDSGDGDDECSLAMIMLIPGDGDDEQLVLIWR